MDPDTCVPTCTVVTACNVPVDVTVTSTGPRVTGAVRHSTASERVVHHHTPAIRTARAIPERIQTVFVRMSSVLRGDGGREDARQSFERELGLFGGLAYGGQTDARGQQALLCVAEFQGGRGAHAIAFARGFRLQAGHFDVALFQFDLAQARGV